MTNSFESLGKSVADARSLSAARLNLVNSISDILLGEEYADKAIDHHAVFARSVRILDQALTMLVGTCSKADFLMLGVVSISVACLIEDETSVCPTQDELRQMLARRNVEVSAGHVR